MFWFYTWAIMLLPFPRVNGVCPNVIVDSVYIHMSLVILGAPLRIPYLLDIVIAFVVAVVLRAIFEKLFVLQVMLKTISTCN